MRSAILFSFLAFICLREAMAKGPTADSGMPPAVPREFRGAWVASVNNIDWPSKPGLPVAAQKKELVDILDRAVELKLNAIILQVRPACDALYVSSLEPWSYYLTGVMGQPPEPLYDPLAFAIEEAHARALELHAWFNPFRARHVSFKGEAAASHVSRTHPEWVREYGGYLWLDPGEPAVHAYSLRVMLDVVKRYDIDGIHLDDYFYPYPVNKREGGTLDFPDDGSWGRYVKGGGQLARGDWRRENVDRFVERLYHAVKQEKKWVKVGISPFGIWRPKHPAEVVGLDAYASLYADSRKWLQEGWLDYFSPQLYWSISAPGQSFPKLLAWWQEQNRMNRHLWPGISTSRVGPNRPAEEILDQITLTRGAAGGNVHWSVKPLMQDRLGIGSALQKEHYAKRALIPAMPWLDSKRPGRPEVTVATDRERGLTRIKWASAKGEREPIALWIIQARRGKEWSSEIVRRDQMSITLRGSAEWPMPDVIAVSGVDRYGNQSAPAVKKLR